MIPIDPQKAELGKMAAKVFGGAWPAFVDNFKDFIPDDNERRVFGERATEEFTSGRYRCYFKLYDASPNFTLILREMVVGCKPPHRVQGAAVRRK